MTLRDDQEVARVDREFVRFGIGQFVFEQDAIRVTERTVLRAVVHHAAPFALSRLTVSIPSTVMTSEPPRWTVVWARAQRYSLREMSVTASAEKVEKVVSPPMKP